MINTVQRQPLLQIKPKLLSLFNSPPLLTMSPLSVERHRRKGHGARSSSLCSYAGSLRRLPSSDLVIALKIRWIRPSSRPGPPTACCTRFDDLLLTRTHEQANCKASATQRTSRCSAPPSFPGRKTISLTAGLDHTSQQHLHSVAFIVSNKTVLSPEPDRKASDSPNCLRIRPPHAGDPPPLTPLHQMPRGGDAEVLWCF